MKAKEYIERYLDAVRSGKEPTDAEFDTAKALIAESSEIIKSRKSESDEAILAVFLELRQKWSAIVRREPDIKEESFVFLLSRAMPKLWEAMIPFWRPRSDLDKLNVANAFVKSARDADS